MILKNCNIIKYDDSKDCFIHQKGDLVFNGNFISLHYAKNQKTEKRIKSMWKLNSLDILNKYRLLSEKTLLVHCGKINKKDLLAIKNNKASIALCPISNRTLNEPLLSYKKN